VSIPATTNVHHLIQIWDEVVTRQRASASTVYVVTHPEDRVTAARTVLGFQSWLLNPSRDPLVPHAVISNDEVAGLETDWDLLHLIATRLEQTMPPRSGRLRLSSFWLLRSALDGQRFGNSTWSQRRRMRNHLFEHMAERWSVLGWLGGVSKISSASVPQHLVATAVRPVLRFAFGLWLSNTWSYSWVTDQLTKPLKRSRTDLLGNCLLLADNGAEVSNHTLVHKLLVEALLRDLDDLVANRRFSVRHRRRHWRPVILLGAFDGAERPVGRLCQSLVEQAERTPRAVVALVAAEHPPEWTKVAVSYDSMFKHPVQATVEPPALRVELGPDEDDLEAARAMDLRPKVEVPLPSWRDWLPQVASMLVTVAAIAGLALVVRTVGGIVQDDPCRWVKEIDGEPVGITDGACNRLAEDAKSQNLLTSMAERNQEARERAAREDLPLRTIVYLTPLEPTGAGRRSASLQQLRGALAAQEEINHRPAAAMQLQLVVADPGLSYHHTEVVLPELLELIESEPEEFEGFVAVTGVSQSWTRSRDAVMDLGERQVLVIGAAVTGMEMAQSYGRSAVPSNYYQVSPGNADIATVIVGQLDPSEEVVVVYSPDPSDLFSADLKDQLVTAIGDPGRIRKIVPYHSAGLYGGNDSRSTANEICREIGQGDVAVLYAGRAAVLEELLSRTIRATGCSAVPSGTVRWFTSTDTPKIVGDDGEIAPEDWPFPIFTASYGDTKGRRNRGLGLVLHRIFQEDATPDAAQGFDAVEFVVEVVELVGDGEVPHSTVYHRLRNEVITLAGASGDIRLGDEDRRPRSGPDGMEIQISEAG
jgi:hypothetical protein